MRKTKPPAKTSKPKLEVKILSTLQNGPQTAADLPVFVGFAKLVVQFIQDLRDAEEERRNGDELTGMAMALAACIQLTNAIPFKLTDDYTDQALLSLPLELLRYAISDSKEGREGGILTPPKAGNRRHASYFRLMRRAEIIATIDDMIGSGLSVSEAAARVARQLREKKFGSVTASQLQSFRNEKSRADEALREFVSRFTLGSDQPKIIDADSRLRQMDYALRLLRTRNNNF